MNLRSNFKRILYQIKPGPFGTFRYYGIRTHFPKGSFVFRIACDQGIYEADNLRLMSSTLRPGATVFDVGANIGLMSIPLFSDANQVRVVSIEPSPQNFAALSRTHAESIHRDQWEVLDCALGATAGKSEFYCANPAWGAFDGMRDTGRVAQSNAVQVNVRTVDELWHERNRPTVCTIKIDVEGAEFDVLRGAESCIQACHPAILVEWNIENLRAFGHSESELLKFASTRGYDVFAMPNLNRTISEDHLRAQMEFGESFALLPHNPRSMDA